jgi:hypothetical protein
MLAELGDWLREPVAVQIAAVGAGLIPESVRGFGVKAEGETLAVGLIDAPAPRLIEALRSSRRVAVNLTHPLTFHGRQFKGPLIELEEPSQDAAAAAEEYFLRFSAALAKMGLTLQQCRGMFFSGPTRWVRMQPLEQFNQSPGPGAGARL